MPGKFFRSYRALIPVLINQDVVCHSGKLQPPPPLVKILEELKLFRFPLRLGGYEENTFVPPLEPVPNFEMARAGSGGWNTCRSSPVRYENFGSVRNVHGRLHQHPEHGLRKLPSAGWLGGGGRCQIGFLHTSHRLFNFGRHHRGSERCGRNLRRRKAGRADSPATSYLVGTLITSYGGTAFETATGTSCVPYAGHSVNLSADEESSLTASGSRTARRTIKSPLAPSARSPGLSAPLSSASMTSPGPESPVDRAFRT